MITIKTLDFSILSIIILGIVYTSAYNRSEKVFTQYKIFIDLLRANLLLLGIDILGWVFNGLPGCINWSLNTASNLLLYIATPIPAMLWILYIHFQVYQEDALIKKRIRKLFILFSLHGIASILSLFTGWFFSVDSNNIYHRGNYFFFHVIFCFALFFYSLIFIFRHKHLIERKYYYSLLLFSIPPLVGSMIQVFYYGVSLNWTGMMLSLLIIYLNIQNRGLITDYLTGVYNRRQLDFLIKTKIRNSTKEKSFSAILIDIDQFKRINDSYGHYTGDDALKASAQIIKKSLKKDDFIARFGGDEFFILLDTNNYALLEQTVRQIRENVDHFNKEKAKVYSLSFCMGYDVFDPHLGMDAEAFLRHIDMKMYRNKAIEY